MISIGKAIQTSNDPLRKIELKMLAARIRQPKPDFVQLILQLRTVRAIDAAKYRQLKTRLPYVVAAVFNPPYRKITHFAYTRYFILDIDHLSDKEMDIDLLFEKLKANPSIVLMFRSPSADGLKLFFKLDKPCYDAVKYSLFYKVFARKFAADFDLSQVVDNRTSDVSRACFVSYDPETWFNPDAEEIAMNRYVNFEDQVQILELQKELKEKEREEPTFKPEKTDIPDEVWRKIRETLNPKIREKEEKKHIVPEPLNEILDDIKSRLEKENMMVENITNINYGKKIRVKYQQYWAEVNVFYGKKGFSVVGTPKNGSNESLMETVRLILLDLLT